MLKRFPVLISIIVLLFMLSFVVAAENTEPESFSSEETTLAMESSSSSTSSISTEVSSEQSFETSTDFSTTSEQATIINRLDLIYTLGLFFVAFLVGLLVIFILWRVFDVFLF